MRYQHDFVAERAAAQHCPQLLGRGPDPAALIPLLGCVGERLARRLAGALAPMLGGEAPAVRCAPPGAGTLATLRESAPQPLGAYSLHAIGPAQAPLLAAIDATAVFRIVDRAFGGKGIEPRPLPDVFPMAAELMIARLETMVAAQIAAAIDAATDGDPAMCGERAITPVRRDGDLVQLAPFAEDAALATLVLEVKEADAPAWTITLALPVPGLPALFGLAGATGRAPRPAARPADGSGGAFGELPLALSARIVDMVLPFASVAALSPGQILPVNVARSVPLRLGELAIAHGTVGAIDDCIAIRITSAFSR